MSVVSDTVRNRVLGAVVGLLIPGMVGAAEVGRVAGEFAVTADGQASYSVPIQVPPGILGVQPSVAIGYHSGAGNGLLGVGGQLSGFSKISRCAANPAEDGFAAGVRHATTDRFCLDGQKLIAVNGSYGADGTEYRTRIDSFQKVISEGAIAYAGGGTGPASFTVHLRTGATLEFGLTDTARLRHPTTQVVHEWRLSRLEDVNGNRLDYVYSDVGSGGAQELLPVRIDYGGNVTASVGHHLALHLDYEIRPDTTRGYQNGLEVQQTQRLAAIRTALDGADVKIYPLGYTQTPGTGESRLVSIGECAGDGVTCFPATTFDWSEPAPGWSASGDLPPDDLMDDQGRMRGIAVDLNRDGRTDWLTAIRDSSGVTHAAAWLGSETGFTSSSAYTPPDVLVDYSLSSSEGVVLSELVDVNGDALPDWVTAYRNGSGAVVEQITLNTGDGFNTLAGYGMPAVLTDLTAGSQGMHLADFVDVDGDGLTDIQVSTVDTTGQWLRESWRNTGSGWVADSAWLPPLVALDYSGQPEGVALAALGDLDGNGLADWIQATRTADGVLHAGVWLNSGSDWQSAASYLLPVELISYVADAEGESLAELIDINGDGLSDVVSAYRSGGIDTRMTWLNRGDGWQRETGFDSPTIIVEHTATGFDQTYGAIIDLNGDSRPDVVSSYLDASGNPVSAAWRRTDSGWVIDNTLTLPLPLYAMVTGADSRALSGFVDINHDGAADLVRSAQGTPPAIQLNGVDATGIAAVHAVDEIVDGFGNSQQIEYASSANSDVYVAESPTTSYATWPVIAEPGPFVLVAAVEANDGIGGVNRSEHTYGLARTHLTGHGALGFGWREVVDHDTNTLIRSDFSQAFPTTGMLLVSTKQINGTLISETTQTLATRSLNGGLTDFPYVSAKTTATYELDGSAIASVNSSTLMDDYGNVTQADSQTADVTGTYTETATQTYSNDTTAWILGQATASSISRSAPNVPSITHTQQRTFNAKGQVVTKTVEPGHAQALTSSYTYDAFGNVLTSTTSATGLTDRSGSITYTGDGRFAISATNALDQVLLTETDPRFGLGTRREDPNGVVTTRIHDALGRQIQEKRLHTNDLGEDEDGTDGLLFTWCDSGTHCPANALYFVGAVDNEGESPETVYYDARAREVRKQSHGFDGTAIYQDTEYTARGKPYRVSRPYYTHTTPQWMTYQYDALDRVIQVTAPNGAITTTVHAGRSRTVTNALNQSATRTLNALGKPVEELDAAGNATQHRYDAAGNLIETRDPLGNLITASFDLFGRKVAMSDPDMGAWTYTYNAFGELTSQTDANSQTTTLQYDALGRMVQRDEPEGITTWTWDTAPMGIGKLFEVVQTNNQGAGGPISSYRRSHAYDDRGRPVTETVTIDGTDYVTETAYQGTTERVDYRVYPSGLTVRKTYNDFGFPLEVRSAGLVEYQAYLDQFDLAEQLIDAAEALQVDLADDRQALIDQATTVQAQADAYAAQATQVANDANRAIEQFNAAASQSRQHERSAYDHLAAANAIQHEIDWRITIMERRQILADQEAAAGNQAAYDFMMNSIEALAGEVEALVPQRDQKIHVADGQAYAANQWAESANQYGAQAQALSDQSNSLVGQANSAYAIVRNHVDAVNSLDQQIQDAFDTAEAAVDQANDLYAQYQGNSILHWTAQGANAEGSITRFTQGNGIVTDLEYYGDTGRLSIIKAMGDPSLGLPLTLDEIQEYLDQLDALITDFTVEISAFEALAQTALNEKTQAQTAADGERDAAQDYRDLGEAALAALADAKALSLDVEVAVQDTRVQLNTGLATIHGATISSAQALISQYEGAAGLVGQGRALEAGYHELLADHYEAIEALYQSLSTTYADLETEAQDLAVPSTEALDGFVDLAAHSTTLADLNSIRAAVFDEQLIAALNGATPSTPLSQQDLSLSSSLLEQRGHLYDRHGDVVESIYARGRDLGTVLSAYSTQQGLTGPAAHYQTRSTSIGQARVDALRRFAGIYKARGTVLLAELDAEQAAQAASGESGEPVNAFADLAGFYTLQSATYTAMSGSAYWQDFAMDLGQKLADTTVIYDDQAAGNAAQASEHLAKAALARNANDHRLLVGVDGTIQDEQYLYDSLGNLTGRLDHAMDLDETFGYDGLNRLTDNTVSGQGAELYQFAGVDTTTYTYDAIGNLTYKSDIGTYSYGPGMDSGSAGIHAVTALSGLVNTAFAYDGNGNQLSGNDRSLTFSSYNKPLAITAGTASVDMAYGPERQLVKQVKNDGSGDTTILYIGGLFEQITDASGVITSRFHLTAAGQSVAVINRIDNDPANPVPETHYLHRDHLNSIVATSNEHGQLIERFHYDPFGQRRIAVVSDDPLGTTIDLAMSDRGFTGHRHLETVNVIHMNGRVFDPTLGRFLSADPHIQYPGFSQSYNRYSYLLNNPMNAIDPSGYFSISGLFKKIKNVFRKVISVIKRVVKKVVSFVKKNWRTILAVAIAVFVPIALTALTALGPIAIGAIAGGLSGFVATGSLKGALIGAVSGAALAGIGNAFANTNGAAFRSGWVTTGTNKFGTVMVNGLTTAGRVAKTVAHAMVGGMRGKLSGASFSKSFVSAGFTQAAAPAIDGIGGATMGGAASRVVAAGVIGGTAGSLAGGQFGDSFMTGVLSKALNDELDHSAFAQKGDYKPTRVSSGDPWWESTENFRAGPGATMSGVEITPWTEKIRGWFGVGTGPSVNVGSGTITPEQRLWVEMEPTKNVMMDGYGNIDSDSRVLWMPARPTGNEEWRYTGEILDVEANAPRPCFSHGPIVICQ